MNSERKMPVSVFETELIQNNNEQPRTLENAEVQMKRSSNTRTCIDKQQRATEEHFSFAESIVPLN